MTIKDGTMALCATCHRAIRSWSDRVMLLGSAAPQRMHVHWEHVVGPFVPHDPEPMESTRWRALHCADCHQPQVTDEHGWHCANPKCPAKEN